MKILLISKENKEKLSHSENLEISPAQTDSVASRHTGRQRNWNDKIFNCQTRRLCLFISYLARFVRVLIWF